MLQQEALIKQLQEQHYQQYMAQVYAQQAKVAGASPESENAPSVAGNVDAQSSANGVGEGNRNRNQDSDVSDEEPGDDLPCLFTSFSFSTD